MSIATKRRFVTKMIETEMILPEEEDKVALVLASRGNNLHEVEDQDGNKYLVSMPTKFRKAVWIKRGKFVLVRPIEEGFKVKAEISHILDDENVLYIREKKLWPERFEAFAQKMTRSARRDGKLIGNKKHEVIDPDMLPPSESDEEETEEESEDGENTASPVATGSDEDGEYDEEQEEVAESSKKICNPNRRRL